MSLKKVGNFINERLVLFVGIGIIASVHWAWYKLQQVPSLVSDSERRDLPLVIAYRYLQKSASENIRGIAPDSKSINEAAQETK